MLCEHARASRKVIDNNGGRSRLVRYFIDYSATWDITEHTNKLFRSQNSRRNKMNNIHSTGGGKLKVCSHQF